MVLRKGKPIRHWGAGAVTKGVCGRIPSDRKNITQIRALVTCKLCMARIKQLRK